LNKKQWTGGKDEAKEPEIQWGSMKRKKIKGVTTSKRHQGGEQSVTIKRVHLKKMGVSCSISSEEVRRQVSKNALMGPYISRNLKKSIKPK